MEPGSDVFLPARYVLRIYNTKIRDYPQLYFQAATPFPRLEAGDLLQSVCWTLGLEGDLVRVESVLHSIYSHGDTAYCEQSVYCDFS